MINLTCEVGIITLVRRASTHDGFLSSPQGLAALDKIKNYYTNIGVWIALRERHTCFNRKAWWQLVYADRIMEAALVDPNVQFEKIPLDVFYAIGLHARDAFGRRASQCQFFDAFGGLAIVG